MPVTPPAVVKVRIMGAGLADIILMIYCIKKSCYTITFTLYYIAMCYVAILQYVISCILLHCMAWYCVRCIVLDYRTVRLLFCPLLPEQFAIQGPPRKEVISRTLVGRMTEDLTDYSIMHHGTI